MDSEVKGHPPSYGVPDGETEEQKSDGSFIQVVSPEIALRPDKVASSLMEFQMLQHHSITNGDWTAVDPSSGNALLKVEGRALNWTNVRHFKDQSGSLFDLRRKLVSRSPSWYLEMAGKSAKAMQLQWNAASLMVEMSFMNKASHKSEKSTDAVAGAEVALQAKGSPGNGYTAIYKGGDLVAEIRRPHQAHRGTEMTMLTGRDSVYECRAAGGLDWTLVALVAVLMSDLTNSGRNSLYGHVGGGPGGLPGAGFAL